MATLNQALLETRDDPQKFDRFARGVLKANFDRDKDALRNSFTKLVAWQVNEARINTTSIVYGPGRVDAFGRIFNKVALLLGGADAQGNPPDAPVSIPFIWRAPAYDKVQYNGIAPNKVVAGLDIGAVGRNVGEVIGVFGDVVPHANPSLINGFKSSIKLKNLAGLERELAQLRPPAWPASILGKPGSTNGQVDTAQLARGKDLYEQRCAECHERISRKDLSTPITTEMSLLDGSGKHSKTGAKLRAPGTDIWMACNGYAYRASTGVLKGYRDLILTKNKALPDSFELGKLLVVTVGGTLFGRKAELTEIAVRQALGIDPLPQAELGLAPLPTASPKQLQRERCINEPDPNLGYTSRPLNGVWATAPFLHNGSVPTMYDLLLPPDQRPRTFYLGTREYDPKKLGLLTDKNEAIGNVFEFNTAVEGNSNGGHDYSNATLSDPDRFAIIEYLKTL
jgi:hypothetical protein